MERIRFKYKGVYFECKIIESQTNGRSRRLSTYNFNKETIATILTHLYLVLNKYDIVIVQGLVTALGWMILLNNPIWRNISHISPFFVPPRNRKIDKSSNFLRSHV